MKWVQAFKYKYLQYLLLLHFLIYIFLRMVMIREDVLYINFILYNFILLLAGFFLLVLEYYDYRCAYNVMFMVRSNKKPYQEYRIRSFQTCIFYSLFNACLLFINEWTYFIHHSILFFIFCGIIIFLFFLFLTQLSQLLIKFFSYGYVTLFIIILMFICWQLNYNYAYYLLLPGSEYILPILIFLVLINGIIGLVNGFIWAERK